LPIAEVAIDPPPLSVSAADPYGLNTARSATVAEEFDIASVLNSPSV
jgi:hypothetical protein